MTSTQLKDLIGLEEGLDYENLGAKSFEKIVADALRQHGHVQTQFPVSNRGDGRRGKIDIVFTYKGQRIPIEIDRKSPRQKSIFKVRSINDKVGFLITRSPFGILALVA